jgi:hypothetical protein
MCDLLVSVASYRFQLLHFIGNYPSNLHKKFNIPRDYTLSASACYLFINLILHHSCSHILISVYMTEQMQTDTVKIYTDHSFSYTGKNKPLSDLLREHNLPPGLFLQNIICYEYDESRSKLVVHLAKPCEVSFKDSSAIRYAPRVKATLSRGKLSGSEGMKTKVVVWVKVTSVSVESYKSDKVCFIAGVKKLRQKDVYEVPREAISVEEF